MVKKNTKYYYKNISLAHLILFSAGLKTYREDGTGDFSEASPELFLENQLAITIIIKNERTNPNHRIL